MNEQVDDPALALALYASSAATVAVAALRDAGHLQDDHIIKLVENLTIARDIAGQKPRLIEHAELLTDVLLASVRSRTGQG